MQGHFLTFWSWFWVKGKRKRRKEPLRLTCYTHRCLFIKWKSGVILWPFDPDLGSNGGSNLIKTRCALLSIPISTRLSNENAGSYFDLLTPNLRSKGGSNLGKTNCALLPTPKSTRLSNKNAGSCFDPFDPSKGQTKGHRPLALTVPDYIRSSAHNFMEIKK